MYHHMLHFFSDQELGVAYTFTASATALAGLVGGPIAAGCLCMDGLGGLAGWQWLFLLEGIPTILFGLSIPVRVVCVMCDDVLLCVCVRACVCVCVCVCVCCMLECTLLLLLSRMLITSCWKALH